MVKERLSRSLPSLRMFVQAELTWSCSVLLDLIGSSCPALGVGVVGGNSGTESIKTQTHCCEEAKSIAWGCSDM